MLSERVRPNSEAAPWVVDEIQKLEQEIERLRKYQSLVRFISNDWIELSYEKAQWQRDDWKKRCQKLIEEIEE